MIFEMYDMIDDITLDVLFDDCDMMIYDVCKHYV